ncbi:sterol desaturase family protein [Vibrio nitrifigilis]|uniref:Sterol desaturase family protein n=1 Tax=Vibrio nitrifigilis TaxID=2789781 RepID=A0ABS0GDL8_9VIBR|nr:sterol desaturase family protein [Vibrio nitrifigilis]MBF9000512.1 sterol desaturase family protein [Vibrio nitrifigilis]
MNGYNQWVHWSFFLLVFIVFAIWESNRPKRTLTQVKRLRWLNHILLAFANLCLLYFLIPFYSITSAIWSQSNGFGILNTFHYPHWVELVITLLVLDLSLYCVHVLFHRLPLLWRIHSTHHSDLDVDVTTSLRFHPVEVLLMVWVKIGIITLLGAPVFAVTVYEILFGLSILFNHSNIRLHPLRERQLRTLIVTPDMHRVHHSRNPYETHSNFGFSISLWDRLLGTYTAQPLMGHERMKLGLDRFRHSREQWIDRLISQPFKSR